MSELDPEPGWDEARHSARPTAPLPPPQPSQTEKDNEHLRLLIIFHYVAAGLSAATSCFVLPHLIIGIVFLVSPPVMTPPPAPPTTVITPGTAANPGIAVAPTAPFNPPAPGIPATPVSPAFAPPPAPPPFPSTLFGGIFFCVALSVIVFAWTNAILIYIAAKHLKARTRHTYCLVVAAIMCLFTPLGIVLAIFTFIVLLRPSVKQQFGLQAV